MYENTENGRGNRIAPINIKSPITEALVPLSIEKIIDCHESMAREKLNLTYMVKTEPNNPNSNLINTFHFKSEE